MVYQTENNPVVLEKFQSPHTDEITTSNFFGEEEDDNDREKRLDESDFINPLEEGVEWTDMFRVQNILSKINAPDKSYTQTSSETNYETYNYESSQEQIPYPLKVLNELSNQEEEQSPLELKAPSPKKEEEIIIPQTKEPEEHPEEELEDRLAA